MIPEIFLFFADDEPPTNNLDDMDLIARCLVTSCQRVEDNEEVRPWSICLMPKSQLQPLNQL